MCLAQGENAVTLLRLKPTAPQSPVKHSTTEPLHSLKNYTEGKSLAIHSLGEIVFLIQQCQKYVLTNVHEGNLSISCL